MDFEQLLRQELFRALGGIDVRRNSVTAEDRAQLLSSVPKDLADEIGKCFRIRDSMISARCDAHDRAGDFGLGPEASRWDHRNPAALAQHPRQDGN